ncbi:hypothetical protein [Taibaiella koreensis]|uniref:hypothetical protein n=1 Tax=Taibaiella koreensis TaxID=1268548 RepID=UPI000E59D2EE|nr:hypothetical protein [Taibaiella koreensis]
MENKLFAIYDEAGFTATDSYFLDNLGQGTKERGENLQLYMSVAAGVYGDFPVLTFATDESRLVFFRKILASGSVYTFSTMPRHLLERFDNVPILYAGFRIRCFLAGDKEGQTVTAGRWIRFAKDVDNSVSANTQSTTRLLDEESAAKDGLYKAYFNAIEITIPEDKLNEFYTNLFEGRTRLPICLPPSIGTADRSYWGRYTLDNKTEVSLPALRKAFWKQVLSSDECDKSCLFVRLLEMMDQPVFTEYIKDGAFFSLGAYSRESGRKEVMDAGGTPAIAFLYPGAAVSSKDFLREWRLSLLRVDDPEDSTIEKIRTAVRDDLQSQIPGSNTALEPAGHTLPTSWDSIDTGSFNNRKARGVDGFWTTIGQFRDEYSNTDVAAFIDQFILGPSAAQGSTAHDHDLALLLLTRYLCKFPFAHLPTYNDAGGLKELADLEIVWQHFALDFIAAGGKLQSDPMMVKGNGKYTYDKPVTTQQIFRQRLLLPPSVSVESTFTAILDYPNALDFNFIL